MAIVLLFGAARSSASSLFSFWRSASLLEFFYIAASAHMRSEYARNSCEADANLHQKLLDVNKMSHGIPTAAHVARLTFSDRELSKIGILPLSGSFHGGPPPHLSTCIKQGRCEGVVCTLCEGFHLPTFQHLLSKDWTSGEAPHH